jgi:hypothetical protein
VPKSYMLCPQCYNNPPFEELKGHAMTCGQLVHDCNLRVQLGSRH